jgi:hypothetical protein
MAEAEPQHRSWAVKALRVYSACLVFEIRCGHVGSDQRQSSQLSNPAVSDIQPRFCLRSPMAVCATARHSGYRTLGAGYWKPKTCPSGLEGCIDLRYKTISQHAAEMMKAMTSPTISSVRSALPVITSRWETSARHHHTRPPSGVKHDQVNPMRGFRVPPVLTGRHCKDRTTVDQQILRPLS